MCIGLWYALDKRAGPALQAVAKGTKQQVLVAARELELRAPAGTCGNVFSSSPSRAGLMPTQDDVCADLQKIASHMVDLS